jgi:multidrug efflux pump
MLALAAGVVFLADRLVPARPRFPYLARGPVAVAPGMKNIRTSTLVAIGLGVAAAVATTVVLVVVLSNTPPNKPLSVSSSPKVDRAAAARYGIAPASVGAVVQMVTTGLKLSEYRPAGADDAVDIVLRLPQDQRTISSLDQLRVETASGPVPLSNFVSRSAAPTTGTLTVAGGAKTKLIGEVLRCR